MISAWNARDVYGCLNPDCRSRVLILRASLNELSRPRVPRCMCGGFLTPDATLDTGPERGAAAEDPSRAGSAGRSDPG